MYNKILLWMYSIPNTNNFKLLYSAIPQKPSNYLFSSNAWMSVIRAVCCFMFVSVNHGNEFSSSRVEIHISKRRFWLQIDWLPVSPLKKSNVLMKLVTPTYSVLIEERRPLWNYRIQFEDSSEIDFNYQSRNSRIKRHAANEPRTPTLS